MTGIDSWSTTAATNATADGGSINWAEGQAPSTVNNTARQQTADIRSAFNDLAWFQYGTGDQGSGNLATPALYASATSFTIAGADVTLKFEAGRRVRAVGSSTGTIYGSISSSSYNGGNTTTTVNVTWDSGSLSNETLVISLCQIPVTGYPTMPLKFGIGMVPVNVLDITQSQNGSSIVNLLNGTGGVASLCQISMKNNVPSAAGMILYGGSYTTSGISRADGMLVTNNGAGGTTVNTGAAQPIYFGVNNSEIARFDTQGELLIGTTTDSGAYLLQVNSQIFATNATIATSDATLKHELARPSDEVLTLIFDLPTRFYERIDRPEDGSRAGYFAQDWEAILGTETGIVKPLKTGKLALDEGAAHSLKIMALEKVVRDLAERVAELES